MLEGPPAPEKPLKEQGKPFRQTEMGRVCKQQNPTEGISNTHMLQAGKVLSQGKSEPQNIRKSKESGKYIYKSERGSNTEECLVRLKKIKHNACVGKGPSACASPWAIPKSKERVNVR